MESGWIYFELFSLTSILQLAHTFSHNIDDKHFALAFKSELIVK